MEIGTHCERRSRGFVATAVLAVLVALGLSGGQWAGGVQAALQDNATPQAEEPAAGIDLAVSDQEINIDAPVAAVIAQGLVYVEADQLIWRVSQFSPADVADADSVTDENTALILQRTGASVIRNDVTNKRARIEVGEAYFESTGDAYTTANYEDTESQAWKIELVPADRDTTDQVFYESESFGGVTEGTYDLELTRGVLFPDDEDILLVGNGSAMIMASSGTVQVTASASQPVSVEMGDAELVTGDVSIRNTGPEPVVYVMASLGDRVLDPGESVTGDQPATDASPAADEVDTADETDATPGAESDNDTDTAATGAPLGAPTVEADDGTDTDGDRLTDAQENQLGTDPNVVDSDEDGMDDGTEVIDFGTDPINPDSDADGFLDGDEQYLYGTDPLDASSFPESP